MYYETLYEDFKSLLTKIMDEYCPESIQEASNISNILIALKTLNIKDETLDDWTVQRLKSELSAANEYADEFLKTRDEEIKRIAHDEIKHFDILFKKVKGIPEQTLNILNTERTKILSKLVA